LPIQKQEFYEGAALHRLFVNCTQVHFSYSLPFFVLDSRFKIYLKYSAAARSPWRFSFSAGEQETLKNNAGDCPIFIGLICGSDGIAALPAVGFFELVPIGGATAAISCSRKHGEYFELSGPAAACSKRIAPSDWAGLIEKFKKESL
jgi:hypothetical protein